MSTHIVFENSENPPEFWTVGDDPCSERYNPDGGAIVDWKNIGNIVAWYYWETNIRQLLEYTVSGKGKFSGSLLGKYDHTVFKVAVEDVKVDIKDGKVDSLTTSHLLQKEDILKVRVLLGHRFTAAQLKEGGYPKPAGHPIHILGDGSVSSIQPPKKKTFERLPQGKVERANDPYYHGDTTITVACHLPDE